MWFRKTETPETDIAVETTATLAAEQNNNNINNNQKSLTETSKFEKFRRASFRRKPLTPTTGMSSNTTTGTVAPRKRSQSPHFILRNEKLNSLEAALEVEEPDSSDSDDDNDEDDADDETSPTLIRTKDTAAAQTVENQQQQLINLFQTHATAATSASTTLLPISDPPVKNKTTSKKATLKALKTDPPKRKFYKNFTNRRQNSRDDGVNATIAEDDALPTKGKEKILLTDPKFRNNRIEKSSSKTKISDLEKRESIKRSRSGRKLAAPAVLVGATEEQKLQKKKAKSDKSSDVSDATTAANEPSSQFTRARAHSNLNLSALVKFVVNNKKLLNANDFALIRRKSISEAASSIISVAASCKPMPIALKYTQDGAIAEAPPPDHDAKTAKNVVLVKKQQFKNSFYETRSNNKNSNNDNPDGATDAPSSNKLKLSTPSILSNTSNKVKRNSSNSSKSSGNFEDEAFYSCDEQDLIDKLRNTLEGEESSADAVGVSPEVTTTSETTSIAKRKSSSPSLTSRVAAKINETTNNYKNRKAAAAASKSAAKKQRKSLATSKRPEYYKQISVERLHSTSIVRQPSDRRPDAANTSIRSNGNSSQHNNSDLHNAQGLDAGASAADAGSSGATSNAAGTDANALDAADSGRDARRDRLQHQHQQNKSAPVSVNRSESYKERLSHKRNRNSRRKTSDPSLTSRPNDEHPDLGLSNSNYTASSNSSLSSGGGSESPSTSMEQVTTGASGQHQQAQHAHQHHHQHQHSHQESFHGSTGGGSGTGSNANNISFWSGSVGGAGGPTIGQLARQWQFESDEEDDLLIEADWSSNVAADMLAALTDAEKKRQEIINEIYQTERNHVRTLKLLERLFFCPLQESGVLSIDHLLLLFPPALLTLRELHSSFEQKLKQRRMEHSHVVNQVGDLLAGMFDGQSGDELREYAAQFCARQQIALEALKEKRRKDEQLQKILSKAESHKACRRLQLKDLLPTVLQRLTKYPLLFENLYKVTIRVVPDDLSEAEAIQRALESSKKILVDVNQAVKHAEDAHKLQNIQRKLDKSTFDKEEFKNLDLTQHRLIHDGSLTMKKNPGIQLHGLLFESMIVLLTKQDDKYSLKYLNATRISEVNNKPLSPIMNIDSETLVRQEAADKNSFFLIKTKTSQMLELRAPSSSECKTWFKHISDAAEQYKPRSKNANHEPVDDPAIATLPHSNTKESLELTPERPPPLTATATMTTTPLAPMMMMPNNNQHQYQLQHPSADMRSERDVAPATDMTVSMSAGSASSIRNNHMNNNDLLSSAVNRTMSTRSCGESNNNFSSDRTQQQAYAANNGVTLRHTQSARQATNGSGPAASNSGDETGIGSGSKRDSNSIIYSNNSNNTRTLMQSSAPLVEPTAIQISISPAHTAEPVLTPAEKLRRLDAAIRDGLLEKQKIICDMFRLPIEHFHEIVDIASLPEAPKDSADIALAAYAQVQSLTEVVNDYMKVTPEQEISAVSTSVCDQCHEKQRKQFHSCNTTRTPLAPFASTGTTNTSLSTSSSTLTTKRTRSPSPPPLPPPNKQQAQAQHKTATPPAKLQTHSMDEQIIHEDDDGYCEIDELRLPALPSMMSASMMSALLSKPAAASSAPPPLPPPAGTFKVPPTPPPPPSAAVIAAATAANAAGASSTADRSSSTSPELTKRQSTISADSIPEESADEVTQAMDDSHQPATAPAASLNPSIPSVNSSSGSSESVKSNEAVTNDANVSATVNDEIKNEIKEEEISKETLQVEPEEKSVVEAASEKVEHKKNEQQEVTTVAAAAADCSSSSTSTAKTTADGEDDENKVVDEEEKKKKEEEKSQLDTTSTEDKDNEEVSAAQPAEPQRQNSAATTADVESLDSEHIEINDAFEALATLNKLNTALSMVDSMSQTTLTGSGIAFTHTTSTTHCGPNRIMHATSLEPSVPCHALNSIVTALNSQISLLLPKINERDMERERLRKENQHLRELLNAMHERQRVEAKIETPKDITTSADANDEIDAPSNSTTTTSTTNNKSTKTTATTAALTAATTTTTTETTATQIASKNSADVAATAGDK